MRILIIIATLFMLTGCESLGTVIKEKKYSIRIHETTKVKHAFGYYRKPDSYVGYNVSGKFGVKSVTHHHTHMPWCIHAKKIAAAE